MEAEPKKPIPISQKIDKFAQKIKEVQDRVRNFENFEKFFKNKFSKNKFQEKNSKNTNSQKKIEENFGNKKMKN